ncbi:MAG: hypothetical protein HY720_31505 [Planctomycetes bacterium]|nr:hypothetical protein [Planctomycetota bacterium]
MKNHLATCALVSTIFLSVAAGALAQSDGSLVLVTESGDCFQFDRNTGQGSCAVLAGGSPAVFKFSGSIGEQLIEGRFVSLDGGDAGSFGARIEIHGLDALVALSLPGGEEQAVVARVQPLAPGLSRGPESWQLTHVRGGRWANGNLKAGVWLLGNFPLYTGLRPTWSVNGVDRPAYPFIVNTTIVWIWLPNTSAMLKDNATNAVSIRYVSGAQTITRSYRVWWDTSRIPAGGDYDFPASSTR